MFSAQYNYYDSYDNEVDYASDLVAADDIETSSVYVSLVLGSGAQFHQGGHDMNVGLRVEGQEDPASSRASCF